MRVMDANPIKGFTSRLSPEDRSSARADQTAFAEEAASQIDLWQPETVILDELGIALALDMVDEEGARKLIDKALSSGETAVTGREVPEWLSHKADYVSRITAEKHPYVTEKLPARKGVEW